MWNMFIGCSKVEKRKTVNKALEEVDIDNVSNREFNINNPETWSKKGLDDIEHTLRKYSILIDGLVCLFTMGQDGFGREIEYGGVARDIKKILVKHCVKTYRHRLLNQEDCKTRGSICGLYKKYSGYVVYLAYQLVESITFS